MSSSISKEMACPHCKAVYSHEMWIGIEAGEHPELRKRILEQKLFHWICPDCQHPFTLLHSCVYHDLKRKFMLCLLPGKTCGCKPEQIQSIAQAEPIHRLEKRLVHSSEELKEKILIFEAGLDDRAVEMVKLALIKLFEKKYHKKIRNAYFQAADPSINYIGFAFFPEEETKSIFRGTSMESYSKAFEIVEELSAEEPAFLEVNGALAEKLFQKYHS